ncbi:MAG: ABC transporter permease [Bacteroidota bacterium]
MNSKPSPPKLALRFFRWFCRSEYLEEIEGDMEELYEERVKERGERKANLRFALDVLLLFRPGIIRSFTLYQPSNHRAMLRHNLILTFRNFRRYKSTFLINLVGLSSGLACALLIFLWVQDELGMDKFHAKNAHLYQILTNQPSDDGIDTWEEGPAMLAEALLAEMPEIDYAVSSSGTLENLTLSYNDNHFSASMQFVDNNYFNIFSFDIVQGDRNQILTDKKAAVISEAMALKLFQTTENVVGKVVEWQFFDVVQQATVTGVFKDVPTNSSVQFDFVLSYEVYKDILGESAHWGNHNAVTYLVLHEDTDPLQFNHKIADFLTTKRADLKIPLLLQRYSDRYLYNHFENGIQAGGRIEYVRLFSIIAVFILVIACINFMNLSTAKASRRIKEIGVKKAIGAKQGTLILQYLGESTLMAFASLVLSIVLVLLLLPSFNGITGKQLTLSLDIHLISSVLGITLLTGLMAGSYPALYLSGFNPVTVLKGNGAPGKLNTSVGEVWARKGLVVFQFALSVILIVGVLVVYQQIEYVQSKNLGFDRENIIYFDIEGKVAENVEAFLAEIGNIPGVINVSSMWGSIMGDTGATFGSFDWEGKDPDAAFQFYNLGVNYGMIELLGIDMKAGRTFSNTFSGDTANIILNAAAIEAMGLQDPIGKIFTLWGNDMEIIGVTKNFNFKSLHESVKPFFFRLTPRDAEKVMVKIAAGTERKTIEKLQQLYGTINPGFVLDYQFLDEEYQLQYAAEQRVSVLSRYFACIAILISCLGLFGLSAFTAQRRLKEIGIRKVLGASNFRIVQILSSDFTKMVLVAIGIALPVSYFIAQRWLQDFAFSIELAWWYFAGTGLVAILIAWLSVGYQTIKAALANPVDSLRNE